MDSGGHSKSARGVSGRRGVGALLGTATDLLETRESSHSPGDTEVGKTLSLTGVSERSARTRGPA